MIPSKTFPTDRPEVRHTISNYWPHPALIERSNFQLKSLAPFSFNTAIGCSHGCRFCYVPSTATNKQAPALKQLGVDDPDAQWGAYVFVRTWDEGAFKKSLKRANAIPEEKLPADGNRAVMFCSTTDPYQVIRHVDPKRSRELTEAHRQMVRRALEIIRDESTLNVRILTRSPLAKSDFDVMASFGPRLLFGMSLPTLNDKLARIYEPHAPAPSQRLKTLREAKEAGIPLFVAMAPTYPQCDEADLRTTLKEIATLGN